MRYWSYYALWIAASYLFRYPPLLAGIVVAFLLRRWIPDPVVLWRTAGRIGRLKVLIEANPQNIVARRDLAMIYLERLRPARAEELLAPALAKTPNDAELLFLHGMALLRIGKPEASLEALVRSTEIDARVRMGEAYLVAGDALYALKRYEEAADAFERYSEANTSSVQAHYKWAKALSKLNLETETRAALQRAKTTFAQIPSYKRRTELGWWLRAQTVGLWL